MREQGAQIAQRLHVQIRVHAAVAVHVEDPRLHMAGQLSSGLTAQECL